MAQAQYFIEIGNEYLGKYRRVTGRTRREVELKAAEQVQRWSEQEQRARERAAIADMREEALLATEDALALIADYRSVLRATLAVDDRLDWDSLLDERSFEPGPPDLAAIHAQLDVPTERPMLERLRLASKEKRFDLERQADAQYQQRLRRWQKQKAEHERQQREYNEGVASLRARHEAGERDAVEAYFSLVLAASALPPGLERQCLVEYFPDEGSLLIQAELPTPEDLPTVVEHRYVASRRVIEEKRMKDRELADFYEDVVLQLTLRTIHEIFEADYSGACRSSSSTALSTPWTGRPGATIGRASCRYRHRARSSTRLISSVSTQGHASGRSRDLQERDSSVCSRSGRSAHSTPKIRASSRRREFWKVSKRIRIS
jgi:restriction system protein